MSYDYDYLIVGSGFGGSVSALRLAEKSWRVGVFEQGRRVGPDDFSAGKRNVFKLMWDRNLRLKGYFKQHFYRHVSILSGVGVGGGSIVWGAVMLEPKEAFYHDPILKRLNLDLKEELRSHFVTVRKMFGVVDNPRQTEQDNLLRETAIQMGVEDTFGTVPTAIYFGEEGDPYFEGKGPHRSGCKFCSGCLTGCEHNAKNSLDKNYLYFAENLGVQIHVGHEVQRIEPLVDEQGFRVEMVAYGRKKWVTARNVILSAGVIGTLSLLFKNRDEYSILPKISSTLGKVVRTNSEAITIVRHPKGQDMTDGTSISTHFYPDANTHVTQNRVDSGYSFMRFLFVPMVDDPVPWRRAIKTLFQMFIRPTFMLKNVFMSAFEKRMTFFTVMQDLDNQLSFTYRRRWWWPFSRKLGSALIPGHEPPSYIAVANEITRKFADNCGGTPMNTFLESVAGLSTTAHILGGCPMGLSGEDSVIDSRHEVHGYPGLFVVDGASIPANIGVNPSMTIAAMAERFASLQPSNTEHVDD